MYIYFQYLSLRGGGMNLEKAIFLRRSVRKYSPENVEKKHLEELLDAGVWAPTAGNIQPWIFVCVTEKKKIHHICTVSPGMLGVPHAVICVCSDQKRAVEKAGSGGRTLALMDCAMAAQNIMLRACGLGLGTCVIRSFNQSAVRELVSAPAHVKPELLVTIGHPAESPKPPQRNRDVIFWEKYNEKERKKDDD
jgi:nitroreductase